MLRAIGMIVFVIGLWSDEIQAQDIDIELRNEKLITVIEDLIDEYDVAIIYKRKQLRGIRVNAVCRDCGVEELLDVLFSGTRLRCRRVGDQYVVTRGAPILGRLKGRVMLKNGMPLGNIEVGLIRFPGKTNDRRQAPLITVTDDDGNFDFESLPVGQYNLVVQAYGFSEFTADGIVIRKDQTQEMTISIEEIQIPIQEIIVTPGWYTLLSQNAGMQQYMTRSEVNIKAHLGDDIFRTVTWLPGTGSDDFSAKFWIRGGFNREVQTILDGMELVDPFHVKDLNGIFSIVDVESIGEVNLMTGGLPVEFGGRMSGVFDMSVAVPNEQKSEVGFTLNNFRAMTEGPFSEGLGHYLVSLRIGNLVPLLALKEISDEDDTVEFDRLPQPNYADGLFKIQYAFGDRASLALHYLGSVDSFLLENDDTNLDSLYEHHYAWVNLKNFWSESVFTDTILYFSDIEQDREGSSAGPDVSYNLDDQRSFQYAGVKQIGELNLHPDLLLKLGWEYRNQRADYDYVGFSTVLNPLFLGLSDAVRRRDQALELSGDEWSAFGSLRWRVTDWFITEFGVRYDRQAYLDREFDNEQVSPRVNGSLLLSPHTSIRLSYGRYHQPQDLNEIDVSDDETDFRPTALAEHWLIGLVQRFPYDIDFRLEGYFKDLKRLHPRFDNLYNENTVDPVELMPDRVEVAAESGEAKGVELALKQDLGKWLAWKFNYGYAIVDEVIDGVVVPRKRDQLHTVNLDLNFRLGLKWDASMTWQYHSGRPVTPIFLDTASDPESPRLRFGSLYSERFDDYNRADLRISRHFRRASDRGLTFYLDVTNLLNHENQRGYEGFELQQVDARSELLINEDLGLRRLYSFGFSWVF